ncbi:hypothetical protein BO71DRAFT_448924 [Aspergillus ellipticus CBS 707.79]|uniref:Altered inheritance of mitochondria protein 9, mitochondrial n=1 Tax=Aspergillus ellipticus CBS 707.79 TaxID=1448320 RepID=A0A319DXB0_9EURO|nr:hypothetical protein BO71DRAFT_448924 [Aspergillus ellipticus CBS 707.79]
MLKRYAKFDLDALCTVVSSLPSISSPVSRIEKMEGGFNKVLLMTADDGTKVVVKTPCPKIVPSTYCTASEVATLGYVMSHTSVPVSKVHAWNSDARKPVGAEHIVMAKAKGRQLVEVWGEMDQMQKFKLIQHLVRLEAQLASLKFPGYGGFPRPLFLMDPITVLQPSICRPFTRVDPSIQRLFSGCEDTVKEGMLPLRESLVQISENWERMGLSGICPEVVSTEELARHRREMDNYKNWAQLKAYTQELLPSDDDGWVSPSPDFEKVKARHADLFRLYMSRETEEISEAEAERLWFHRDRDE